MFEGSPCGRLVPINGTHEGREFNHFAFVPNPLPPKVDLSGRTWGLLADAMHSLGKLDNAGLRVPNPRLLARPSIRREAVSTSALEGTYTTLPQILESEMVEDESDSRDVNEVRAFIRTAELGYGSIDERSLTQSLIKDLHASLMQTDPRCPDDEKGTYRKRQNFIGPKSAGIVDSFFVPPPPGDAVQDAMDDWINWIHDLDVPLLARVALGHYQFETIHPFFDGNGRIGRLLIILQLIEAKKLTVPILEISPFLEDRRDEYQQHLRRLSYTGEVDAWVTFFAEGVKTQSERGASKVSDLLELRDEMLQSLHADKVRGTAIQLAEELIGTPVLVPARVARRYEITYPAAVNALERLCSLGFLRRVKTSKRKRMYLAPAVVEIVNR